MKKFTRIWMAMLAMVCVSFTSCLGDSDSSSSWDVGPFLTLDSMFGLTGQAKSDDGIIYYINNPSDLKYANADGYPERVRAYLKVTDEEGFDPYHLKSSYHANVVGASPVHVRPMTTQPDTLKQNPVNAIGGVWAANGYLNIPFDMNMAQNAKIEDINAYIDHVGNDTLYVKFDNGSKGSSPFQDVFSFRLSGLNNPGLNLTPKNDSIVINVTPTKSEGSYIYNKGNQNCKYPYRR